MEKQTKTAPTQSKTSTSPGWAYDAVSGFMLSAASYEEAERFKANGGRPIVENRYGYPHRVVIRQEKVDRLPVSERQPPK